MIPATASRAPSQPAMTATMPSTRQLQKKAQMTGLPDDDLNLSQPDIDREPAAWSDCNLHSDMMPLADRRRGSRSAFGLQPMQAASSDLALDADMMPLADRIPWPENNFSNKQADQPADLSARHHPAGACPQLQRQASGFPPRQHAPLATCLDRGPSSSFVLQLQESSPWASSPPSAGHRSELAAGHPAVKTHGSRTVLQDSSTCLSPEKSSHSMAQLNRRQAEHVQGTNETSTGHPLRAEASAAASESQQPSPVLRRQISVGNARPLLHSPTTQSPAAAQKHCMQTQETALHMKQRLHGHASQPASSQPVPLLAHGSQKRSCRTGDIDVQSPESKQLRFNHGGRWKTDCMAEGDAQRPSAADPSHAKGQPEQELPQSQADVEHFQSVFSFL